MAKKVIIGNILEQQKNKRGWLVGQFMEDPFKSDDVEIYYKTFSVGDTSDRLHKHPVGSEYLIVVSGRAKYRLGENIFEIKAGDYLSVPANTPDQIIEVIEDIILFGVRTPSIPNNKILIET